MRKREAVTTLSDAIGEYIASRGVWTQTWAGREKDEKEDKYEKERMRRGSSLRTSTPPTRILLGGRLVDSARFRPKSPSSVWQSLSVSIQRQSAGGWGRLFFEGRKQEKEEKHVLFLVVYTYMYVCMYVRTYVRMYVCMYVSLHLSIYLYVYISLHLYIYIHYTYIHT